MDKDDYFKKEKVHIEAIMDSINKELTARADFPLPRNPGNGQKRWRAKDVLAWVESFKAKEAKL